MTAIPDGFSESVFLLLSRVDSLVTRRSSRRMTSTPGISAPQAGIVHVLATSGRCSTDAELGITPSAISRLVGRVQGQGLLVRSRSTEERHIRKLTLTPQDYKLATALAEIRCSVVSELFSGMTLEELSLLVSSLRRIHSNTHGPSCVSSVRRTPDGRQGVCAASSSRCRRTAHA